MGRQQAEERRLEVVRRDRARRWLADRGVDPEGASWSLTPSNGAGPVPLALELREEFRRYLVRIVEEAVHGESGTGKGAVDAEAGTDTQEDRFPPPTGDEARALGAACATCRGWCCRRGGTHAFLEADRIRRLMDERPDLTPADVVELYTSHLGATHLEGGCVFQGEQGCRLPRDLRGDTCNAYLCPDLVTLRRRLREPRDPGAEGPESHWFVAVLPGDDVMPRGRRALRPRPEPGSGPVHPDDGTSG
jgi:hypothetical protein